MIVLLVGLTLSHLASTYFLSFGSHDTTIATSERLCADHVAVIAHLIEKVPSAERAALLGDLAGTLTDISLSTQPKVGLTPQDEDELSLVQAALRPHFGAVGPSRLHVAHGRTATEGDGSWWRNLLGGFPHDRIMQVSLQLKDGQWVNFDMAMVRGVPLWSPHTVLSTVAMMVGVLVFGGWATGWVGRPLATFAAAADRLGRDVNAPRLPENGPREVRRAVVAFNEMQDRIRRFVDDRTQMLAAISHDLRSPITRLRLRTELLAEGEGRDKMLRDLDEMEAMVASSLDFARDEAADEPGQDIDLAATLEAICDNTSDIGLRAAFEWDGRLVCHCRPAAIKRALSNLIENAARYGGKAMVRAHRLERIVAVVIEDSGPGIAETELDKVFNPFYRVEGSRNRKTGGIGLGLSVARSIVRSHGGDIRLENRVEGGLRATVTIPQGACHDPHPDRR
ncbi:ATP-binding protein [Phaeospirillum tilakii]|uniref:histidine kinase n=1 Tax=Phaeospirillum tilakii TaxID=741673 RepID=A0ABW5CAF4_9PROT